MSGAGLETVLAAIARTGLVPRGAFLLSDDERRGALADVRAIVLAGMAGRDGWGAFAASAEAGDGLDHPLDRWSRRVIEALARDLGATALFPFGGPPFWPFQQWARRSEPVYPSPIGLLIHPALRTLAQLPRGARVSPGARRTGGRGDAKSLRVLPRAPVPERLSRRRFFVRRLRRRRLRRPSHARRGRRLHECGMPGAARLPLRRRARLWPGPGEFHHAGVSARPYEIGVTEKSVERDGPPRVVTARRSL